MQMFTLHDGRTVVVDTQADGAFKLSLPMAPHAKHWAIVEMDDHHVVVAPVKDGR